MVLVVLLAVIPVIWCEISSEMMQFLLFIRMLNMPVKRTDASLRLRYEEFVAEHACKTYLCESSVEL